MKQDPNVRKQTIRGIAIWTIVLSGGNLVGTSWAQEILAPPAPESQPYLPPAPGTVGPGDEERGFLSDVLTTGESILQYGIARLNPRVFYQFSYGDGIRPEPGGSAEKTIIQTVTPGVTLALGEKWAIDYSPSFRTYSSDRYRDTWNHSVVLSGGTTYRDWAFGVSQSYRNSSNPRAETATQTDQDLFTTSLSALYQINSRLGLQLGLAQNLRFAEGYVNSYRWSTMNWLNYSVSSAIGLGLGAGGGYVEVSEGLDSVFEQVMGRVSWQVGEKLSLGFNGGVDFRQFLNSDLPTLVNPIYGVTGSYRLFDTTTLFVSGSRSVSASYYRNQVNEYTRISGGVRQRILERFNLTVSGSYRINEYVQTVEGFGVAREDDGYNVTARLSTRFFKKVPVGVFYHWSQNNSDARGFAYDSTQVGFDIGYAF